MLFFGIVCSGLFAQSDLVSGRVIEQDTDVPLVGATIKIVGTSKGVVTDATGRFSLEVDPGEQIEVSYTGYATYRFSPSERSDFTILLTRQNVQLDAIVVTALGISRQKRSLGYAVDELESKDLTEVRESNLVNAFAGRIAGVQTTNGASGIGSSSRIVIRGETSLSGSNQALFVVDGIPINNEFVANDTENLESEFQSTLR